LPFVNFPTRNTRAGGNVLDLIFAQDNSTVLNCKKLPPLLFSDHFTVSFQLEISLVPAPVTKDCKRLNYKKADFDNINRFLASFNWDRQLSCFATLQSKYDHFSRIVIETIESNCPIFESKPRRKNKYLTLLMRKRNSLRGNNQAYRLHQRKIRNYLYKIRCKNEAKIVATSSPKQFFSYINRRIKSRPSIPSLVVNDSLAFTDKDKCDVLCKVFAANYSDASLSDMPPPIYPRSKQVQLDIDFSFQSVFNYLKNVPSKTSVSGEKIPQIVLRKCALPLAWPLSIIFQESYNSGILPSQWKDSTIVPVFKKGSRSDPQNYRPISLTSTICRVMEKMLCFAIRARYSSVIDRLQFGFLPKRSCTLSLLHSISSWQKNLKLKNNVDVVYFDFKAAFDKCCHEKLMMKLRSLGFEDRALSWFHNFLSNRSAAVRIGDSLSSSFVVKSGVPQGTVSGPLLFLLFINDLQCCIPNSVEYVLYADDLKLFSTDPTALQIAVNNVLSWSHAWELPISIPKTNVLYLGKANPRISYTLNNIEIVATSIVKDLGVVIDEKLTFETHINQKVALANQLCRNILLAFSFPDPLLYFELYNIYVRPVIEYSSEIYSPGTNSSLANTLEQPLRSYTKMIFKRLRLPMCSYTERLQKFSLKSQVERRIHADLIMCFNLLYGNSHFPNLNLQLSTSPRHPLRLIRPRNVYLYENFFFARVHSYWNQVAPFFIEEHVLLKNFKSVVQSHNFVYTLPYCLR
jgi:hypothetical protein